MRQDQRTWMANASVRELKCPDVLMDMLLAK
jgi:hypothetical protein